PRWSLWPDAMVAARACPRRGPRPRVRVRYRRRRTRVDGMAIPVRAERRSHPRHRVLRGAMDPYVGAHHRHPHQPTSRARRSDASHTRTAAIRRGSHHSRKRDLMITTYRAAPDIDVVSSTAIIPGFGSLAINA